MALKTLKGSLAAITTSVTLADVEGMILTTRMCMR